MDKTLVRGAMLIALTVVLQSLRLFIPLPPMASMFFIGTLVNMMLAVTVRLAGLKPALLAVVLLPFFAYLQGQLPIPLLIPVVTGGNAVLCLSAIGHGTAGLCWRRLPKQSACLRQALCF